MISSVPPCPPPSFQLQRSKRTFKSPATSNTPFPPFHSLLHNCSSMQLLHQIHALMLKTNAIADPFHLSKILSFSSSPDSGDLHYAFKLFSLIPQRNSFHWNTLIHGFSLSSSPEQKNLLLLIHLLFPPVLRACGNMSAAFEGIQVHCYAVKCEAVADLFVLNSLVQMYFKCRLSDNACIIFDRMPERNVVSWNCVIGGFAEMGMWENVKSLFWDMVEDIVVKPNALTLVRMVTACTKSGDLNRETCAPGILRIMGFRMPIRNTVAWNAMMYGYVLNGYFDEAISLFIEMLILGAKTDEATMITILSACSKIRKFAYWPSRYVKTGQKEVALEIFHNMPRKRFGVMECLDYCITLVSSLSACAGAGALELGKWLHAYIKRNDIEMGATLCSALIDMYAKCGCIELSLEVFESMQCKDLVWSTIIGGLSMNAHSKLALEYFERMVECGGVPDSITFIGVLSACSHAGLIEEGKHYFLLMTEVYGIPPTSEHCGCMVDLFARQGLLSEAKDFIDGISISSNGTAIWGALLGACTIYGNLELAEYAARHLLAINPANSGAYVLLSNVYAKASRWSDVRKVRNMMKEQGIEKIPGCSSIEVNGVVHEFFVGDFSHSQGEEIYMMLNRLEKMLQNQMISS
ncbi:LOW QUALITY PROTEIN: pentatricopeptide repeat-containing protein At2g29760, chloroplastic-like [Dioscorea cayenensis subsp. rotundata]|uniref:LOW QUALITY PROTEIN: pentatricopeptide repeat-containing protein At2g29760, chloroplastic-like n=1 Tax=Dioscorea cayennensis subsp. rotundata TaxID=55577 RepID=A0AB40AWT8_DIOCR|nr:LOW QUALITY PROTEIN: pentatricopeptide repeat-containing protein At2g29760, chloroplastic-like [Dioscorea cayenensis subsp. rotundata]